MKNIIISITLLFLFSFCNKEENCNENEIKLTIQSIKLLSQSIPSYELERTYKVLRKEKKKDTVYAIIK